METTKKLKAKELQLIELVDLFFDATKAVKYTETLEKKLDSYIYCQKWSKRVNDCVKNVLIIEKEIGDLLEKEGAYRIIGE